MKMRRVISALTVCALCMVSLCACTRANYALKVGENSVSKEIYGYYYSVAANSDEYKDEKDKEKIAAELCAEYISGRLLAAEKGVSLSAEEKVSVSSKTKSMWQMYSSFYKKYSVTKEALCEALSYDALTDKLTLTVYGEGGEKEEPTETLENYFYSNYAAVKIMSANFKKENGESFDEAEVEEITKKFTNMRNSVRSGAEMSSVAEQYIDIVDYDDKVKFLRSDDTEYPSGMFEKISEIQTGSVQVFRYERGIYLIQKIDMKSSPSEYFDVYKNECLLSLKRDEMKKEINTIAQNQELVYNHKVTDKFA